MSDLEPLTTAELAAMEDLSGYDLGPHAEEGDEDKLRAMVQEIRIHRDAAAPFMLRAARLYSDELGALRKRVAEFDAGLIVAWSSLTDEQRLDLICRCCRGCGVLDTSCQCWNDE